MKKTQLQKAIQFIREHPDLTAQEATQAGRFSKSTFFKAKGMLRESPAKDNPFAALVTKLKEMGVQELHYKDGRLRVATITWREVTDGEEAT